CKESYTRAIIQSDQTEVHQCLRAYDRDMPERLAQFFDDEDEPGAGHVPPYLAQIVSGQLDADRCDYLLRDSHATGTNYGNYDLEWLISHVVPQADGKRFYLSRKALSATEAYVFARFHMYRTVYFHKTTRAAEVMLRLVFQRFKELLGGSTTKRAAAKIVPNAPRATLALHAGQMSLPEYLELDEHALSEFLKACARAQDKLLAGISAGLLNR